MRILLLLLLLSSSYLARGVRRLVAEFKHNASHNLSSLLIEEDTGRIYLAGTNILYQLDDSLRVRHRVETGWQSIISLYIPSLPGGPGAAAADSLYSDLSRVQVQCWTPTSAAPVTPAAGLTTARPS